MRIDQRTVEGKSLIKDIESDTRSSQSYVQEVKRHAARLTLDPDDEYRRKESECIECHYGTRIAGSAMTQYECKLCHETHFWSSTNIPKFCGECAKDNSLCRHCGSRLYGRWEV